MENGVSTALMVLVGVIIFGIFVFIIYWLFEDEIQTLLENIMADTDEVVTSNLDRVTESNPW